jgi:RNA polymerase sigma-70 factor (ECF subfamily)
MDSKDLYFKLFLKNNKKLFSFIVSCVPNHADAEDILQETAAVLWTKFDDFQPDTNFYAWAKQIVKYKISHYYRQKKNVWKFDPEVLNSLIDTHEILEQSSDMRMTALQGCLNKLDSRDIHLLQIRYQQGIPVRQIAKNTKLSVSILYKRLACIYVILKDCITQTLLAWEASHD